MRRFGKKTIVIQAHVGHLLNLKPVTNSGDVAALRVLLDNLQVNIRGLEALGIKGESYSAILVPLLLSRLPEKIRLSWARSGGVEDADIDKLIQYLQREVESLEFTQISQNQIKSSSPQKSNSREHFSIRSNGSATSTTQSLATNIVPPSCSICSSSHYTNQCEILLRSTDKRGLIREKHLCFNCLRPHLVRDCKSKFKCRICQRSHHTILHEDSVSTKLSSSVSVQNTREEDKVSKTETTALTLGLANYSSSAGCLMQTTIGHVKTNSNNTLTARILFDTASSRSYIKKSFAKSVASEHIGNEIIRNATFGGKIGNPHHMRCLKVDIVDIQGQIHRLDLLETANICSRVYNCFIDLTSLPELNGVQLADINHGLTDIDILIGMDNYWSLMGTNSIKSKLGITAQESVFGYILSGKTGESSSSRTTSLLTIDQPFDVQTFWNLDSIGVLPEKPNEDRYIEFKSKLSYNGKRYKAPLLWIDGHSPLLNNEYIARQRLRNLDKRLEKNSQLRHEYNDVLQKMEVDGFIEQVPSEDLVCPQSKIFYLPHRPVVKTSSATTKIRPVFDASAKGENGVALNNCLDPGPSLLPDLVDVLVRFRRWKIAMSGDIKQAFLQIELNEMDKDVHRFLWRQGELIRHMRFNRVTFGVNCSPFILNAVIKTHLSKQTPSSVVNELTSNLYVDDFLSGADTVEEAIHLFNESKRIMSEAGMNIRQWSTNSLDVLDQIQETSADDVSEYSNEMKLLGLGWNRKTDSFYFLGGDLLKEIHILIPTKRILLSSVARIFDPLGFLTPYVITAKILSQDVWRHGTNWDDKLTTEHEKSWKKWINDLKNIEMIEFPRRLCEFKTFDNLVKRRDIQLHVFGDASESAYGAAVYLRASSQVTLIISRARVAPIKTVTLPRLELLAATLATRLMDHVKKALDLSSEVPCFYWTDSNVVLAWIRGSASRWKPFVGNRVMEIQQHSEPSDWRHCPGKSNPADLLSRPHGASALVNSLWWGGPSWLGKDENFWPKQDVECNKVVVPQSETRASFKTCLNLTTLTFDEPILDILKHSDYSKLLRITAYVLRIIVRMKERSNDSFLGPISSGELNKAELYWIKVEQQKHYRDECTALKRNQPIKLSSPINPLRPFMDLTTGVLRVGGRLDCSNLSYDTKHPIIIPEKSHLAKLIVRDLHCSLLHCGISELMVATRERLHIRKLRKLAKSIKSACVICKRYDQRPCNEIAAPLPHDRVNPSPPFYHTGVDYCGPVYCKGSRLKHYICLFTCATTRAIHLELSDSLSTEEFILSMRKFVARRGAPTRITSDNATTFVKASKDFFVTTKRINWSFIAPRSPWWGGFWERLVRTVKNTLKKTIGGNYLTKKELLTVLCEVEFIINNRPLTYVSENLEEPTPLSPAHFLFGKTTLTTPVELSDSTTISADLLRKRYIHLEKVLNNFWKRWQREYLLSLPTCVPGFKESEPKLKISSIVLIREDGVPRSKWKMGRVVGLIEGRDGRIRAASLQTADSGTLTRAVQRLHFMEL